MMTIEDKRNILFEYCENTDCIDCTLRSRDWRVTTMSGYECIDIMKSPESDLDKALYLIENGSPKEVPYRHEPPTLKCKIFTGNSSYEGLSADNHFNHWIEDHPQAKIWSTHFSTTPSNNHQLCVFYTEE